MRTNVGPLPEPLKLDPEQVSKVESEESAGGISATAKFEQYEQKRRAALQVTPHQLKKIAEKERDEHVYQYLTPDEIWQFKDALKKAYPAVAKLDVQASVDVEEPKSTANDFKSYAQKRREIKSWSDNALLAKKPDEIEAFYEYLTPEEILELNEKLENLRKLKGLSLKD